MAKIFYIQSYYPSRRTEVQIPSYIRGKIRIWDQGKASLESSHQSIFRNASLYSDDESFFFQAPVVTVPRAVAAPRYACHDGCFSEK